MDSFKVDTVGARFRVDGVEGKTDGNGAPIVDKKSGGPKFVVYLTVRYPERQRPDKWMVTVVGAPRITVDSYVSVRNVVAYPWEQQGRFGVALRAESIEPETTAPTSVRTPATSTPSGS